MPSKRRLNSKRRLSRKSEFDVVSSRELLHSISHISSRSHSISVQQSSISESVQACSDREDAIKIPRSQQPRTRASNLSPKQALERIKGSSDLKATARLLRNSNNLTGPEYDRCLSEINGIENNISLSVEQKQQKLDKVKE